MISNLSSVLDGTYVGRIQDALGNSGASARITTTSKGVSVEVSGKPTGEGLKIRAETAVSSEAKASPVRDIITLSPAARSALSRDKIALQIMNSPLSASDKNFPEVSAATNTSVTSKFEVDPNDVAALAQQDPTQVIHDAVAAAKAAVAQISTTNGLSAALTNDPSAIQKLADGFPDQLGPSFIAAIKAGTAIAQLGQEVGYGTDGEVRITATSQSYKGASSNFNFDISKMNVLTGDYGFGQVVFSWPK